MHRLYFAFTVTFHYLFPQLTMGLALLLVYLKTKALRTGDEERRQILASVGPVWDGNEVWLLARGGTMYFALPQLYASGFSGFYLPLMIVLWLLILRWTSIEFRNQVHSLVWDPLWDFLFCVSSLLLAVFYGAALANVVRGVPLDGSGYFFEPLWTNFGLRQETGILDWYTILVGVLALVALVMHGGLWVEMKTSGAVSERSGKVAGVSFWLLVALTAVVTVVSFGVQPQLGENFRHRPMGYVFPLLAIAGGIGVKVFMTRKHGRNAFLSSCVYLAGMLTSVVFLACIPWCCRRGILLIR